MNMSDDVAAVTLQISMKAAETSLDTIGHVANTVINDIAKLLRFLAQTAAHSLDNNVNSTNLTDISPGEVKISELFQNAKKNGDSIALSENGLSSSDKKIIQNKSKEYGIPVAFTQGKDKDNIFAHVRSSDLPVFQRICMEMIKDKIATRPQTLGNFKVKNWEIPFIKNELNKHDLAAQFGKMKDGQNFCLFDKADEKAILIARGEYVRKANEVSKEIIFDRDEEGLLTLKDIRTGKEVSFEATKIPTRDELSSSLQLEFSYDKNKADLACARFGQEQLSGDDKVNFFSDSPQKAFSKIETNITLKDENIFVKPYTCLRVTPNANKKACIVFQSPEGRFAVISPEKMSKAKMYSILSESLGITNKKEIEALIEKAEKVIVNFAKQDAANYYYSNTFSKSDFDMKNPAVVQNMKRIDASGNVFTKSLPVDKLNVDIERISKERFKITSNATFVETDTKGVLSTSNDTKQLILSFSDKKNALHDLIEIYKSQGITDDTAKQIAKETFHKAENQNAEKILVLEEIRADEHYYQNCEIDISFGQKVETISMSDSQKAKDEIKEKFNVSAEAADAIYDKADREISERQKIKLNEFGFQETENWTRDEASEMISKIEKNGWNVPAGIDPSSYKPDSISELPIKPEVKIDIQKPELPKINISKVGRGGR